MSLSSHDTPLALGGGRAPSSRDAQAALDGGRARASDDTPAAHGAGPAVHQGGDTADRCLRALGLTQNPFSMAPDTVNFYSSSRVETIIVEVLQHVETRMGFALLCGEVGLGKTTISRRILHELDCRGVHTALVFNTFYQGAELLREINKDFGVSVAEPDLPAQMAALNAFLLEQRARGRNCVIIIDDAQNLTVESLELVRQISNMETGTDKIVQIILVGQTELEEKLNLHSLRQLKSRIVLKRTFRPYSLKETETYIRTKIARSGDRFLLEITDAAIRRVHTASQGAPRRINVIMGRCLYAAVASKSLRVTRRVANLAIRDVAESFEPGGAARFGRPVMVAAVVAMLMVVPLALYKLNQDGVLAAVSWREPVRQLVAVVSPPAGESRPESVVEPVVASSTAVSSPHPGGPQVSARAASIASLQRETAHGDPLSSGAEPAAAGESVERPAPDAVGVYPPITEADGGAVDPDVAETDPVAAGAGMADAKPVEAGSGMAEVGPGAAGPDVAETGPVAAGSNLSATNVGAVGSPGFQARSEQSVSIGDQPTRAADAQESEVDPAVREFLEAYELARFEARFETALQARRFDSISRDILDSTGLHLVLLPAGIDDITAHYDTLRIPGGEDDSSEYLLFWAPRYWAAEHFTAFYTPQAIAELQLALKQFGSYQYYIDGLAGPQTTDALGDFQHAVGLPRTRDPDVATLFMLEHVNLNAGPGLAQSGARAAGHRGPDAFRPGVLE